MARWDKRDREGWRPTRTHLQALASVAENLELAHDARRLALAVGVDQSTVARWRRSGEWRSWWNSSLLELARAHAGPSLLRLVQLIRDPKTSPSSVGKLVDTLCRRFPNETTGDAASALFSVLEKWKSARSVRVGIEIGAAEQPTRPQVPWAVPESLPLADATQPASGFSLEPPPPGAMTCGPPSIEARARQALGAAGIDHHQGEAEEVDLEPEVDEGGRPWDRLAADAAGEDDFEETDAEGEGGSESQTDPDPSEGPGKRNFLESQPEGPARISDRLDRELRRDHGGSDFPY